MSHSAHMSAGINMTGMPPYRPMAGYAMPQQGPPPQPPILPTLPSMSGQPPTASNGPPNSECIHKGRIYKLKVRQQPVRARMCGFGDKDRRPITPPPCIQLLILDAITEKPIEMGEIDTSFFVLTVDLWSQDGTKEVNLVRHSANSPSISAATSAPYPPPPVPSPSPYNAYGVPMATNHMGLPNSSSYNPNNYNPNSNFPPFGNPMNLQPQSQQTYFNGGVGTVPAMGTQVAYSNGGVQLLSPQGILHVSTDPRSAPSGMFTRNLIGSLCVSAFKLADPEGGNGVWFVLQDLSVRTEGIFRLKMNFVDVSSQANPQTLSTGSAPVLASVYSDEFQVFSAKKFPGVIESTALSKCFATQGIKIPIRKDGLVPGGRKDLDDDDE